MYFAVKSNPKLLELCEGDIREAIEQCIEKDKTEEPVSNEPEYVESVLTELLRRDCLDKSYDCQHLLILYKSLRPEAETADEAAKIILDRLSGYDILKEEESLAQKVIDMFPPSLALHNK